MIIKKLSLILVSFTFLFAMGASLAFAQTPPGSGNTPPPGSGNPVVVGVTLTNPFGNTTTLFALMKKIVDDILLPIGGVLAVLAFIFSGFLYVTAQGKEAQIAKAHKALLYTAIGTAVLLGAAAIASVICITIQQLGGPACS